MFLFSKALFIILILQPMVKTQSLFYQFTTVPIPDVKTMYGLLANYASWSKTLRGFDGDDKTNDYTTTTWMEDCYRDFYAAGNASFVLFWLKENFVYCEIVSAVNKAVPPTFPIGNLMRVERPGARCQEIP